MMSASATQRSQPGAEQAGRRRVIAPTPSEAAKSSNASAVVYFGSNPNSVRIRVVSTPRP